MTEIEKRDFTLQILVILCIYTGLTAAAPLIGWEWVKPHSDLKKALLFFLVTGGGMLLHWRYRLDAVSFSSLPSVHLVKSFIDGPAGVSITVLFLFYYMTQFLSLMALHAGMETALWDFAFFDQILWNTARGDFMTTSVRGGLHVYAEHFKPILIPLSWIYAIYPNVNFFFGVTTFFVSLTLPAVYLITRRLHGSHRIGLLFSVCVFFYSPLRNGINFPFHSQTLADPLILFGFYFILRSRNALGILMLLLAMMCKQNVILAVLGTGCFLIFKGRRAGWVIMSLSLMYLAFYLLVIEPRYYCPEHFRNKWSFFDYLYSGDIQAWKSLLEPNPAVFLYRIFMPFLFLSFFARGWHLLLLPPLALHLLSSYGGLRIVSAHYTAGLNALIFISSIYGFIEVEKWLDSFSGKPQKENGFERFFKPSFLYAILLGSALVFACLPQFLQIDKNLWRASNPVYQRSIAIMETVPSGYSVLANERLSAHLAHRRNLFVFFSAFPGSPKEKEAWNTDLVFVDRERIQPREREAVSRLIDKGFRKIFESQLLEIYSGPASEIPPELIERWNRIKSSPVIPYRTYIRFVYAFLLGLLAFSLLGFLLNHYLPKNISRGISFLEGSYREDAAKPAPSQQSSMARRDT